MEERLPPAGRGVLFLAVLGALTQGLGFGYRVVLSRLVGAQVMGLYHLLMPVYSILMSLTAVGLTAAVSNLTAQRLALGDREGGRRILRCALRVFLLLLLPMALVVLPASDAISVHLLGDARTRLGLILLLPCAVFTGVENLHKHAFYGAGVVGPPAIVDLLEQLVRAAGVLGLLLLCPPQYPERTVGLIVTGMILCEIFSSSILVFFHRRHSSSPPTRGPVYLREIAAIALPVGLNALLGNLLSAANATLIPQKLVQAGLSPGQAVSQFGVVCGMTLPLLGLPTVFLGALNLVLSPRMTRAFALGRRQEACRLLHRALDITGTLILPAMALMAVLGPDLGRFLYHQPEAGLYFLPLAAVMAMSSFCCVLCAALNAVGGQRAVALISLAGGGLQLIFTLALVPIPEIEMAGYVAGAVVSTGLELFLLLLESARRLGPLFSPVSWLTAPGLAASLAGLTGNLLFRGLKDGGLSSLGAGLAALLFFLLLYLSALFAQGIRVRQLFSLRKWA